MPPMCARTEIMAAWSKEVRIEMERKGKIPIKVLELLLCHVFYLTTYQTGTQKYLTKAFIIHHIFIEHLDSVVVTGDLNF